MAAARARSRPGGRSRRTHAGRGARGRHRPARSGGAGTALRRSPTRPPRIAPAARQGGGAHSGNTAMDAKEFISKTISDNPIVLFMKGDANFPQCGFSGRAVQILKACGVKDIVTVDVLADDEVRQGINDFSNWPTIPQLYINGEFIGGSDILYEMYQSGELQGMLEPYKA